MKSGTWIVVANSATARIFKAENNNVLIEINKITHPESRLAGKDLETDRSGRSFDGSGAGSHAVESSMTPKDHEALSFAKQLTEHLQKEINGNAFNNLYLVASPSFLGLLRQQLPTNLEKSIVEEVAKDVTTQTPDQIRKHLPYVIQL